MKLLRYFTRRCPTDAAHRPSALSSVIAAVRAAFLSVLITRGGTGALERSVLARNRLAEAVFRLVDR
jgi:hypothetical protein